MLEPLARAAGLTLNVIRPYRGETLPSLTSIASTSRGLIILGGGPGPLEDDRYNWLAPCRKLCLDAVETTFPLFGICLGEELLGAALGSAITRRPEPAVGLCTVIAQPAAATDPLFSRAELHETGTVFRAFQWLARRHGVCSSTPRSRPQLRRAGPLRAHSRPPNENAIPSRARLNSGARAPRECTVPTAPCGYSKLSSTLYSQPATRSGRAMEGYAACVDASCTRAASR